MFASHDWHFFTLFLSHSAVDIVTSLVTLFEDHYPERLKKVYVINGSCHSSLTLSLISYSFSLFLPHIDHCNQHHVIPLVSLNSHTISLSPFSSYTHSRFMKLEEFKRHDLYVGQKLMPCFTHRLPHVPYSLSLTHFLLSNQIRAQAMT